MARVLASTVFDFTVINAPPPLFSGTVETTKLVRDKFHWIISRELSPDSGSPGHEYLI